MTRRLAVALIASLAALLPSGSLAAQKQIFSSRTLGVRVSFRGEAVTLTGTSEQLERATPVVQGLLDLARMGEPFFTTKPPGRGMGLGLFLARAVIEGVGGSLQIDTDAGGTDVLVTLPTDAGAKAGAPRAARSDEATLPQVVSKPA